MSARKTVVRTTCVKSAPAAFSSAPMLRMTWSVCAVMSPSTSAPVEGSNPTCPERNSRLPARMPGLYGPMGFAASGAETGCRTSGRLGDLAGTEAPGADPDPLGRAVDQRPHQLQVRLEPPGSHVVGV